MALLDVVRASIGETVSILYGNVDANKCVEGCLVGLDTSKRIDDYPVFLVVKTDSNTENIPLNLVKQFFTKKMMENDDTTFYYIIFRYGKTERSKEHIYMSYDHSIRPGDRVLVWKDWLYVGNVIRTGFFKRNNAPYPVEKTWLIEKKVYPRVDFLHYPESKDVIRADNLYKDKALNSDNDYRQFLAVADEQYQWLYDYNTEFLESRSPELTEFLEGRISASTDPDDIGKYIVGQTEWELDGGWFESNQIDVFYKTLWICILLARVGSYNKFYFDKFLCLSLVYKHGDFDKFMLDPEYDKANIERDVQIVDAYLAARE